MVLTEPLKPQIRTNLPRLLIGATLLIMGIALSVTSALPVTQSNAWFDQTFQVQERGYYTTSARFHIFLPDNLLHIYFDLQGEGVVNFYVMDKVEFTKYESGETFEYYAYPSAESVATKDVHWSAPNEEKIYFVWDNSNSITPQTIYATIEVEGQEQLMPPVISFLGVLILLAGLSFLGLAFRPLTICSSSSVIIVGYVFAVLGGLIGLLMGMALIQKGNEGDKFHGKAIFAIGVLALILYISFYFL